MTPVKTKDCNLVLTAPADRPEVIDLHVWRGMRTMDDGRGGTWDAHVVESFWQPSAEEILALRQGGRVVLSCVGLTAPPVWVGVTA